MSPAPPSPATKLSHSHRLSSQGDSSADGIRKRVCKACDRCRLKKSKCDGSSPCSRCKADNAICVFGERKKSHDKVYPKGYVEMLEQQQTQLVSALQEMYRRLKSASAWDGNALHESHGHPLTHDILAALDLLESKHDGSGEVEAFEEDCGKLQSRLISEGHALIQRRGSFSSESEHSQHGNNRRSVLSGTPVSTKPNIFKDNFSFNSNTSSPLPQSPAAAAAPTPKRERYSVQPAVPAQAPYLHDPQLYSPDWAQALSDASAMPQPLHSRFAAFQQQQQQQQQPQQQPELVPNLDELDAFANSNQWSANLDIDSVINNLAAFPQYSNLQNINDVSAFDSMDVDFSKFVNVNQPAAMEVYM